MNLQSYLTKLSEVEDLQAEMDYDAAHEAVVELLARQPYSPDLLVRRAMLEQLLNREEPDSGISLESVRAHLETAHQLQPRAVEPLLELGHLAYAVENAPQAGLEYFEAARDSAETALREALLGKIKCLVELGEPGLALTEIESAAACFGDDDYEELRAEASRMRSERPER